MEKKPVNVSLLGKKKKFYQIKFPHLQVPVEVNEDLYVRMRHSNEYHFDDGFAHSVR